RGRSTRAVLTRSIHCRAVGKLQVDVTDPDDQQDAAAALGLGNRVDARLQARGNDFFRSGDGQVLELWLRQVNHLAEVVALRPLVQVFVGEADRHSALRNEGIGT